MNTKKTCELPLFGRKLRMLRKEKQLTQEGLAKEVGMTREMIAYLEARSPNPTAEVIRKFADYFQVSSDVFLYEDSDNGMKKPGPKSSLERKIEKIKKLPVGKRKLADDLLDTVLNHSQVK